MGLLGKHVFGMYIEQDLVILKVVVGHYLYELNQLVYG